MTTVGFQPEYFSKAFPGQAATEQ